MAMMAKMRSLAPAFIISVGAIFVLFMIISDSNVMESFGGRTNNVGSVNGTDISYNEFSALLEQQRENQRAQTGQDIEDEQLDQFREQVWDAVVTQKILEQQIDKFNITVSDEEVRDIILSDNPPQFLKQNFVDSLGNFNRSAYEQAIYDPQNNQILVQAEEFVRQQRLNEKLQSMLLATVTVSEAEIKRKFIDQSIQINARYALADVNKISDSAVTVNDDDLKNYYNENINKYKINPQRKLKYVLFKSSPSASDTNSVRRGLEDIVKEFKRDTVGFRETVTMYSSSQVSSDTVSPSTIQPQVVDLLTKASKGDVVGPVATSQGMALYHLIDVVPAGETVVRASHILINNQGSDEANLAEANKVYDQIMNGASFEQLAREKSGSPEGQTNGGDLGWFGKGRMVPEFEKAAMEGQVGVVQKPVKTSFGYHIVKTTGRTSNKYVVEWVTNPIKASASTIDEKYNSAADLAYLANKNGFDEEAKLMNYEVLETPPFTEDAYSVPGIGVNKRLVTFAFESSLNDIAEQPFRVPGGYAVVKISEVINEGVKPFDEVKDQLMPQVRREKKFEKAKEVITNVKQKINGDLDKAPSINEIVMVNQTGSFSPGSAAPTVGRDFAFIEKALELDVNKLSEPVKGQRGYYLIKVTERTQFDSSAYSVQRNSIRDNLLREKKNTYFQQWLAKMKKDADIVDNRHIFYGQ